MEKIKGLSLRPEKIDLQKQKKRCQKFVKLQERRQWLETTLHIQTREQNVNSM
jgi:hypothetical protein